MSLNGPVPTGALLNGLFLKSASFSSRCFGRIGTSVGWKTERKNACGAPRWNTTVWSSGVSMDLRSRKFVRPRAWSGRITCSTENFTSALVMGLPSWNLTPRRSRNVQARPSADTRHDSASDGTGFMPHSYASRLSKILLATSAVGTAVVPIVVSVTGSGW